MSIACTIARSESSQADLAAFDRIPFRTSHSHLDAGREMMNPIEERRVRSITERATPMWDRALDVTCLAPVADLKKARDRLNRWQKVLGGADALNRRLQGRDLRSRQLALHMHRGASRGP